MAPVRECELRVAQLAVHTLRPRAVFGTTLLLGRSAGENILLIDKHKAAQIAAVTDDAGRVLPWHVARAIESGRKRKDLGMK